ncbi:flagellar hook-associated protein 2 [Cohaesibacter sp. ES.047]|uniref:flagellar filament capping protein FliD n=1 Tax=Cohaesibacter sp. ES.047 TaxID=1798205 RepID=UPI000BB98325|nr:flagellar filament capping protein FliD [Cohaesibacter sp. ES.047]SNY91756.1 flagellar hook-associated protein 2 [Cohaesibacter sp. ES.047]
MTDTTTNTSSASTPRASSGSTYSPTKRINNPTSDIDWNGLVEAAVLSKKLTADRIDSRITETETKIEAYSKMQDLLQAMQGSLKTLCGSAESLTKKDDVFSRREAYLTGSGGVNAANAVVVTADAGVDIQTYDLNILQLAKAQKIAGAPQGSNTEKLDLSGTFSLKLADREKAVEIAIDETMSLNDIARAINNENSKTGINATVVQVNDDEFTLVMTAEDTGQDIIYESVSGDDIGHSLGLTAGDGSFARELQAAQSAIIKIDGIEITRSTNSIDDVIKGVNFSIYQKTGEDESVSVEISQSLNNIKTAISGLVESYNAYREWAMTQQAVASGGGASSDATLFGDSILRSVNASVAESLSTMVGNENMAFLGLEYDENNFLVLDNDKLNEALLNDLDQIEDLLNFQYSVSNNDLGLLYRNDNMPAKMTIDIEVDEEGNVAKVLADGQEGRFEVNGTRIVGVKGTQYEGVTFVYTGDEDATIDFTSTAGMAESLFHTINEYADEDQSVLTDLAVKLQENVKSFKKDYKDEMSTVENYRLRLINLYSKYQEQISGAESTLSYLKVILDPGD